MRTSRSHAVASAWWCEGDSTYESPDTTNFAVVNVLGRYAQRSGVAQRERIVVDGAEVVRAARNEAVAIPVRAGHSRWFLESRPVIEREYHWTTTSYRRPHYHTGVERSLAPGCEQGFEFDAAPGATYRVEFEYRGPGMCNVRCAREIPTASGLVLAACEGFEG